MIILVLINIIFIVCVYLKYYKFPKDIDVDNIENEEPIIIGYVNDLNKDRLHHEIYMSDARKVAPEKWKTVIRHPIKKL